LAAAIVRIWYFDGVLDAARERVFPDGTLELVVQLDTPHRPADAPAALPFPPLCMTGLRTTAEVVQAPFGRCRVLGIRLTPSGAFRILGQPLHDITSLTADVRDVLPKAAELGARVYEAHSAARAVAAAATWTAKELAARTEVDAVVERAVRSIASDGGARSIAEIDVWRGRSRARFGAAFRDAVGVSPKRFARIMRFDRSLRLLTAGGGSLGDVALDAGYYDQAHFSSEFRTHAGLTPRAYLHALRFPGSLNLTDSPDQNFQDAAVASA
jgi:AraC-like DNA-binding protein